jgi:hypothetical protein
MPDRKKLKPCPFCGNQNPVYWCYTEDGTNLFSDRWAVLCYYPDGGCGAEGSHQKSKEEAAAAWNERQPQIVRCNDCKYFFLKDARCFNKKSPCRERMTSPDWFCANGERRDDTT